MIGQTFDAPRNLGIELRGRPANQGNPSTQRCRIELLILLPFRRRE
jgi:hypothetical protein